MTEPIACTVAMLTFNNADTLDRALKSVRDVAEVIIADGGSTDATVAIAESHGRTVVAQSADCQDRTGRLVNYGAAREQLRLLATQPWLMQLDSDEYASEELIGDLRRVCSETGETNVYRIQARYEYRGKPVARATTYPMSFPRLYRRSASTGYAGITHERAIVSGPEEVLNSGFVIPFPEMRVVIRKWSRYLRLDVAEARQLESAKLAKACAKARSQLRWFLRDLWVKRIQDRKGLGLPIRFEAARGVFYVLRYAVFRSEVLRRRMRLPRRSTR